VKRQHKSVRVVKKLTREQLGRMISTGAARLIEKDGRGIRVSASDFSRASLYQPAFPLYLPKALT